jgi:hypothetical protein
MSDIIDRYAIHRQRSMSVIRRLSNRPLDTAFVHNISAEAAVREDSSHL